MLLGIYGWHIAKGDGYEDSSDCLYISGTDIPDCEECWNREITEKENQKMKVTIEGVYVGMFDGSVAIRQGAEVFKVPYELSSNTKHTLKMLMGENVILVCTVISGGGCIMSAQKSAHKTPEKV